MPFDYLKELLEENEKKIVLLVLDGLGGLPVEPGGFTELEAAHTPNMDRLAKEGSLGQTIPIRPGVTPGSGPAHLSLFGYDPIQYIVGRGALEACGIGLSLKKGDIAVRCNFATIDEQGKIIDRRAGRISTEDAVLIVQKLQTITLPGVEIVVKHVKEHRFAILMRGDDLSPEIGDTDPQETGVSAHPIAAHIPQAEKTAALFRQWSMEAEKIKIKYGCGLSSMISRDETIEVPGVGNGKGRVLSRQILGEILEPRVEEIFNLIHDDLTRSGYEDIINSGVVITGGSSELPGIPEVAEQVFNCPSRIGYPQKITGLVEVVNKPMYATAVGLVIYGAKRAKKGKKFRIRDTNIFSRVMERMKKWFKDVI